MNTKILLLTIFAFLSFNFSKAQDIYRRVKNSQTYIEANQFLNNYRDLDSIKILYVNKSAKLIQVNRNMNSSGAAVKNYDLSFDGDCYLFEQAYKGFTFPELASKLLADQLNLKENLGEKTLQSTWVTMKIDTLKWRSVVYRYAGQNEPQIIPRNGPFFKGNLQMLTSLLDKNLKQWKNVKITDSVLIMMGWITKDGTIDKIEIIEGKRSLYAEKILAFLTKQATSWSPRIDGGLKRRYYAKISVRVNKNRNAFISIL